MRIVLTDEREWAAGFDWTNASADGLRRGFQQALAHWREHLGVAEHPRFIRQRRLRRIDAWETERLSREGIAESVRRDWRTQAGHWRGQAEDNYRRAMGHRLSVTVQSPDGELLCPGNRMPPALVRDIHPAAQATAERLWQACNQVLEHHANVSSVIQWVTDHATELRTPPGLTVIDCDHADDPLDTRDCIDRRPGPGPH